MKMSGHTTSTHAHHYNSSIACWRENIYEKFHCALGEPVKMLSKKYSIEHLTKEELLRTLKVACGDTAVWTCKNQEKLVHLSSNSFLRHSHCNLPCGYGKSMAWIIPTLGNKLTGKRIGLRLVILS